MIEAARDYGVALLLALVLHALVFSALWVGWQPMTDSTPVVKPQLVVAELVMLAPPKPKARPKPAPTPAAKPEPQPDRAAEQRRAAEQQRVAEQQQAQKRAAEQRRAADQKAAELKRAESVRQQRLAELASSAFDLALAEESQTLAGEEQEQVARSYAQGIYQLIVTNWSRPPSARNGMQTRLVVELVPTGDVVSVTVIEGSGNEAFDRSAEQAVRKVGKFDVPDDPAVFEQYFRRFPVLFRPEDLMR